MPEVDLTKTVHCLKEDYTPVRDGEGRLVGAIPKVPDDGSPMVADSRGINFMLGIFAQQCVLADTQNGMDPSLLPGFVGVPGYKPTPLEQNPLAEGADPGANPDLGIAV